MLESKTVGDGYAALTMLDFDSGDPDEIEAALTEAMSGVLTAMVTRSVRDSHLGGLDIARGDYIGFAGKEMLADADSVAGAAQMLLSRVDLSNREVVILICGKESTKEDTAAVRNYLRENHPTVELFEIDGEQDIYPLIFVIE